MIGSFLKQTLSPLAFITFLPPPRSYKLDPQLPLSASQDAMRETVERIRELEKALRESMNTSAHRESLWAQEEAARVQAQRQVDLMLHSLMEDQLTYILTLKHTHTHMVLCILTYYGHSGLPFKLSTGTKSPRSMEDHMENVMNLTAPSCG